MIPAVRYAHFRCCCQPILSVPAIDYEIDRDRITLGDILGEGQFGDVHRGIYHDVVSLLFVFLTVSHVEPRNCSKSVVGAS